jgi:ubiquinol-cytochrome c reductase subunit 6
VARARACGQVEESCKPQCVKALLAYQARPSRATHATPCVRGADKSVQACTERIKRDHSGEAHCTGQYFDYWSCIDKCVRALLAVPARCSPERLCNAACFATQAAPKLFARLK